MQDDPKNKNDDFLDDDFDLDDLDEGDIEESADATDAEWDEFSESDTGEDPFDFSAEEELQARSSRQTGSGAGGQKSFFMKHFNTIVVAAAVLGGGYFFILPLLGGGDGPSPTPVPQTQQGQQAALYEEQERSLEEALSSAQPAKPADADITRDLPADLPPMPSPMTTEAPDLNGNIADLGDEPEMQLPEFPEIPAEASREITAENGLLPINPALEPLPSLSGEETAEATQEPGPEVEFSALEIEPVPAEPPRTASPAESLPEFSMDFMEPPASAPSPSTPPEETETAPEIVMPPTIEELAAQADNQTDASTGSLETTPVPPLQEEPQIVKKAEKAPKAPEPAAKAKAPKSKPKTVAKPAPPRWTLRSAQPGQASLSRDGVPDIIRVQIGDTLPGLGRITAIEQTSTGWIVRGTQSSVSR